MPSTKKRNDVVPANKIEKMFVMQDESESEHFQELLKRINEEYFAVSEEIISYAEAALSFKLSEHIHISLTDHLAFSIERLKEGIILQNRLLNEIKVLYEPEFKIGMWAINHVKERFGIDMPIDEAAYIALHIHTAKIGSRDIHQSVRQASIIASMVEVISSELSLSLSGQDIAYERLITHLRFVLNRVEKKELHTMDKEMLDMIKKKFEFSFNTAMKVSELLERDYKMTLPEAELGYIALHVERLRSFWGK
ncbi:sucrose utilization operon antiterminator [Listeria floridensis FSL S10-1187]|uniref:Sucrose utilization operon antiterminator n=1 Tax=Listeria floridensis FSL S10-1187 TaxID=1265817 RepID=A0ABN0RGN4_9LIST|nr:sucrose utilization operon antiterminator [Listeria floridensis FSL S10-1187]